jgi:hypothetical protein
MRSTLVAILSSQSKKARPPVFHFQQQDDSKDHDATGILVTDRMSAREQPVSSHITLKNVPSKYLRHDPTL